MKRWFWKRWAWAGVFGATVGMGLCLAQPGGKEAPPGPPKVGDVISLKFRDGPERQVKIIKSEKQPDGSYHSEVKDTKTGETFTLVDNPGDAPPAGSAPARPPEVPADKGMPPKAKQRASDPLLPSVKTPMPETPRERMTPPTPGADKREQEPETPKRRGLIGRIFGKKPTPPASADRDRDTGAAMPSVPVNEPPVNPGVVRPSPSSGAGGLSPPAPPAAMPPAVRPTPTATNPPPVRPTPGATAPPTATPPAAPPAGGTAEPPRTLPVKPAQPMTPTAAAPSAPPIAPPVSAPVQVPPLPGSTTPPPVAPSAPMTSPAVPSIPSVPPVPAVPVPAAPSVPGGLPSIPVPPGGTAMGDGPAVVPAGHASPATAAMPQEVQQHLTALRSEAAPSRRAMAVRAMTTGPHGSTDAVKAAVFEACQKEPSAFVRGYCIDELCRLGYREAAFLEYLEKAYTDPSDDVKTSAKLALARLKAPK